MLLTNGDNIRASRWPRRKVALPAPGIGPTPTKMRVLLLRPYNSKEVKRAHLVPALELSVRQEVGLSVTPMSPDDESTVTPSRPRDRAALLKASIYTGG